MNTVKFLNEIANSSTHSIMDRTMAGLLECDSSGEIINKDEAAKLHSERMNIDIGESIQYADMVSTEAQDLAWAESENE